MREYAEADRMVEEGLSLARRIGNRYWESSLLGHCYPKFATGRWDELVESLDQIPPDEFARAWIGFTQGYVAFGTAVEVHRGDLEGAAAILGRRSLHLQAHASRIEARSADGADPDTERLLKSSIGSFREIGFPLWMEVTPLEYGEWLAARDRGPDAAPILVEARSIFEGPGATPWLDRAARVPTASAVPS